MTSRHESSAGVVNPTFPQRTNCRSETNCYNEQRHIRITRAANMAMNRDDNGWFCGGGSR